jgi:murein DD-endopeptidase MepM/ murein hydrolase activator NlpD
MPPGLHPPLPGHAVTQPFGPSTLTVEPDGWYQANAGGPLRFRPSRFLGSTFRENVHNGQDVRANVGTPIQAPVTGRVIVNRVDPASGDHYFRILVRPGTVVQLDHLSEALAAVGAWVIVGQPVALSGASGHVTGPHLHWGVYHYIGLNPRPDPRLASTWFAYNPARCLVGGDLADAAWLRPAA